MVVVVVLLLCGFRFASDPFVKLLDQFQWLAKGIQIFEQDSLVVSNSNCIGTYRKCSACAADTVEYVTLFTQRFHNEWFTTVLTFHCPHSLVVRRRLFYSSSLIDEKFCFVKNSFQGGSPLVYKTRENLMLRCLGRDYTVLAVFFGAIRSQTLYTRRGFTVGD